MKKSAGIDFGTTNSTAAIATNNMTPVLVPVEDKHVTIPTAIFFPGNKPEIYFGRDAQNHYIGDISDGRYMRSLKRILGTPLMQSMGTLIGKQIIRYDEIISYFVKHLKNKIDIAADDNIENVVMGRPVHFRDNDHAGDAAAESELRTIALNAGFKNVAFQFEPIAAAFAHERLINSEKLAVVIDIGGGTSDFTVIRLSPARRDLLDRHDDVLANTGVRIGGNDFDKSLSLESFMPLFGMGSELRSNSNLLPMPVGPYFDLSTWNCVNDVYTYKYLNNIRGWLMQSCSPEKLKRLLELAELRLGHTNLDYVETAKIKLSDTDNLDIILDFLSDAPEIKISRTQFESAIENSVSKIQKSMSDCLNMAGVKSTDIDLVILTGGSTEIPYISNLMKSYFPNAEISASDKLSSVGLGLAYDSIRRF